MTAPAAGDVVSDGAAAKRNKRKKGVYDMNRWAFGSGEEGQLSENRQDMLLSQYDDGVKIFITLEDAQGRRSPQGIVPPPLDEQPVYGDRHGIGVRLHTAESAVAKGGKENMLTGAEGARRCGH